MLKYTFSSPLIQNILQSISLISPKRSLNYISLPFEAKICTLIPQYFFLFIKILQKNNNLTYVERKKNTIAGLF